MMRVIMISFITLGEGKGDNWWCVLFPPLCIVEAEESDHIEYKSFIKELTTNIYNNHNYPTF